MKNNTIFQVHELTAGYGKKATNIVLNELSFRLDTGELVCLMGPNGSGKSTLIRCISGLQQYHSGSISIKNKQKDAYSLNEFSKLVSVVLTDPILAMNMTVRELITMGRYPHMQWLLQKNKEDRALINSTAEKCGVAHLLDRSIYQLSDGQRQKALIARALAQEAEIMILDEPTNHLDLNNRVEIISLLKNLTRDEGKSILMATHELDLALQMADRIFLLNDGTLYKGIPEDLVLNGRLDEVFSFKGYDLKTGKVLQKETERKLAIKAEGHIYLWTKNALEREGFTISENNKEVVIATTEQGESQWIYKSVTFNSLEELIPVIKKGHPTG